VCFPRVFASKYAKYAVVEWIVCLLKDKRDNIIISTVTIATQKRGMEWTEWRERNGKAVLKDEDTK
jgi:hypothetical protein